MDDIRNRIVEVRKMRFGDVANHPRNPKRHPESQRKAFRGSLQELGFVSVPLAYVSERNEGRLTWADGHLRGSEVNGYTGDVAILDIDDAEADKLLLYADPIAAMAEYESQQLDSLLRDVQTGDEALQAMLAGLAQEVGLYPESSPTDGDWMAAFEQGETGELNTVNITFVVPKDKKQIIVDALAQHDENKNDALVKMAESCLN